MSLFGSILHVGKSLRLGKNSITINPVSPIYSLRELFFIIIIIIFSLFRGNTCCFISRVGFKTFFEPNGFCVNLLTRTFPRKNDKYPTNARVVVSVSMFPINSGKCLVKKSSELDHKVSNFCKRVIILGVKFWTFCDLLIFFFVALDQMDELVC